jgi:hypothetical protein
MGAFAETAIVDYHLSFADQGKQTSIFHVHFPYMYICKYRENENHIYIYMYLYVYVYVYLYVHIYVYVYMCMYMSMYMHMSVYRVRAINWPLWKKCNNIKYRHCNLKIVHNLNYCIIPIVKTSTDSYHLR